MSEVSCNTPLFPYLVAVPGPGVGILLYPILFPPFVAVGDRVLLRLVEGDPIRAFLALLPRDRLSLQCASCQSIQ